MMLSHQDSIREQNALRLAEDKIAHKEGRRYKVLFKTGRIERLETLPDRSNVKAYLNLETMFGDQ